MIPRFPSPAFGGGPFGLSAPHPRMGLLWLLMAALLTLLMPGVSGSAGPMRKRPDGFTRAVRIQAGRAVRVQGRGRSLLPRAGTSSAATPAGMPTLRLGAGSVGMPTGTPAAPSGKGGVRVQSSDDPLQGLKLFDFSPSEPDGRPLFAVASSGSVVMAVGVTYATISTDGGSTFRHVDLDFITPHELDLPFSIARQQLVYAPSINRFIWVLEVTDVPFFGGGRFRLAVASPEEAAVDSWKYWDISHGGLETQAFFRPILAVGANAAYLNVSTVENQGLGTTASATVRAPLAQLAAAGELFFEYFKSTDLTRTAIAKDLGTRAYWAGLTSPSNLRAFWWDEGDGTVYWNNIAIAPGTEPTLPETDTAALSPLGLWVGWSATANPDAGFPNQYARVLRVSPEGAALLQEHPIWTDISSFGDIDLAAGAGGEVGFAVGAKGSDDEPAWGVGLLNGTFRFTYISAGSNGLGYGFPARICRYGPLPNLFITGGSIAQGGNHFELKGLVFGRSGDIPDQYEPDNDFFNARELTTPQTHNMHRPGDADWAYFDLTEPHRAEIETSGQSELDDTVITLYDPNLTPIGQDDDGGGHHYSRLVTGPLQPGRYYIRVNEFGEDGQVGEYFLRLKLTTGFVISGHITQGGAGLQAQVRFYSDPSATQLLHTEVSDAANGGYWEYRVPDGSSFFIKPFASGYSFSAPIFLTNIGSDVPGLDFTATPVAPPAPPTNFGAFAFSDTQVLLFFDDQAESEEGFEVRYGTSGPNGAFTPADPGAPAAEGVGQKRFFLLQGLQPNTQYWFKIRALPQQDSNTGLVSAGPLKTLPAGQRLLIPLTVKIPKTGKAKVGTTKAVTVKITNPFPFPIPAAVPQPAAPFGISPRGNVVIPAGSSRPLKLDFTFSPTSPTPKSQTAQVQVTLQLPGTEVRLPVNLEGTVK